MTIQNNSNEKRYWQFITPKTKAIVIGGQVFKPHDEAPQAVALSALEPGIAAEVEALVQNRPELASNAIKAGQLVEAGKVEMLHLNHFRVEDNYIVYFMEGYVHNNRVGGYWNCQCSEWRTGNIKYNYKVDAFGREVEGPVPPYVPGLGICCPHVLACILAEAIAPHAPCPACEGRAYQGFENVETALALTCQAKPCPACNGTGAVQATLK